jgi:myo-inositol 2-dehydrogenase/D-chiro-inositol 1-dehydrogenase
MSEPLAVALIGCGRAAERLYLPAFAATREARIHAVVDPRPERRALLAGLARCAGFEAVDEMLRAGGIGAAIVLTPPTAHLLSARPLLEAQLPVLMEKPLAPTLPEGRELAALAARAGVPFLLGFNRRWWTPAEALRARLAARSARETLVVKMVFRTDPRRWDALAGAQDVLDDLASHQLDLLRFLCGRELAWVRAERTGADGVRLSVGMTGGSIAECIAEQGGVSEESIRVTASGVEWQLRSSSDRILPPEGRIRSGLDLLDALRRKLFRRENAMRRSFARQLAAFVRAVRENAPASPGIADGLAALQAVEAARASLARGGAEVKLG